MNKIEKGGHFIKMNKLPLPLVFQYWIDICILAHEIKLAKPQFGQVAGYHGNHRDMDAISNPMFERNMTSKEIFFSIFVLFQICFFNLLHI